MSLSSVGALVHDPVSGAAVMLLIAAVFLPAAWHKLGRQETFRATLAAYQLVPASAVAVLSLLLGLLELLVIAGLVLPATRPQALQLGAALLLVYGLAMAVNLVRNRMRIDCGCGLSAQTLSWALVLRNVLLAVLALVASAPLVERVPGPVDVALAVLCGTGFYVLYGVAGELIRQAGHLHNLKEIR